MISQAKKRLGEAEECVAWYQRTIEESRKEIEQYEQLLAALKQAEEEE